MYSRNKNVLRLLWKCLIQKAASPGLYQLLLEFEQGRLTKMTIYEIVSLAINLANLILEALSYLKNKKS